MIKFGRASGSSGTLVATGSAADVEVGRGTVVGQLAALTILSAAFWGAISANMAAPWVVPDEIIYSDLAKSLAAGHLPALRGVTTFGYGVGYPLLIAPAWALGTSTHTAYVLTLVINAVLMSSAAVPAYLLARRFVPHSRALIVGSFAVVVPAIAFSSTMLTENAYYPAFLFSQLAIVRALERPTARRQLVTFATIAVASATKLLGGVLMPVYLSAIVVTAVLGRRRRPVRATLGEYRLTWIGAGLALAVLVVGSALRGDGATGALGAYSGVLSNVDLLGLPWAFVLHVGALDLTAGFIPFAATCLVLWEVGRGRLEDQGAVRFAALAAGTMFWLAATIAVSAGAIKAGSAGLGANAHLHERYLFMACPLLLIGLGLCLEHGLRSRRQQTIVAAAICVLLAVVIPVGHLRDNAALQAPSLVPWLLFRHGQLALAIGAALAGLCFVRVRRRTGTLWLVVGLLFAAGAILTSASSYVTGRSAREVGISTSRSWIDDRVGSGAKVVVLWNEPGSPSSTAPPRPAQRVIWDNEFFNRSVRTVYSLGAKSPEPVPEIAVRIAPTGIVERVDDSSLVQADYVLTCGIRLEAPVLAVDRRTAAVLYQVAGRVRVQSVGLSTCHGDRKGPG